MPKFIVLIYGDEAVWDAATPEWVEENGKGHQRFRAAAGDSVLFAAELGPSAEATSIRAGVADGAQLVTDGPFLESKEIVGGYYYLDAPDMRTASRLAALLPEASASHGGVEVRQLR